jgi:hypothetical protein
LAVCQVLHYERWGAVWACVVSPQGGEEIGLLPRQCARSVVRLGEPIHTNTSEWAYLERELIGS